MIKPWNAKTEDIRVEDTIINFIIFCEDSVSEPVYFDFFETERIKINCVKNQKSMMKNVVNAIHHCQQTGLITHEEGQFCVMDGTHVWCVFDRDKEETKEKIQKGNIEFDASISTAQAQGLNVAWSNDSFELWILLHFEDIDLKNINRETYYNRLTDIFKTLPNPNTDLQKVLTHKSYSYKRDFKSETNFRNIVRAEIVEKTTVAIGRAEKLEKKYNDSKLLSHEKSPYTSVHHLVKELIRYGGKL